MRYDPQDILTHNQRIFVGKFGFWYFYGRVKCYFGTDCWRMKDLDDVIYAFKYFWYTSRIYQNWAAKQFLDATDGRGYNPNRNGYF
jgi:hypothetical protein